MDILSANYSLLQKEKTDAKGKEVVTVRQLGEALFLGSHYDLNLQFTS